MFIKFVTRSWLQHVLFIKHVAGNHEQTKWSLLQLTMINESLTLGNCLSLHSVKAVFTDIFFIFSTAENIGALCLILQVKNDDLRRTVLNSVVGTLDVCVRHPLHGEKFPEVGYNCTFSMFFFLLLYLEVIHRSLESRLFTVEFISLISQNLGM